MASTPPSSTSRATTAPPLAFGCPSRNACKASCAAACKSLSSVSVTFFPATGSVSQPLPAVSTYLRPGVPCSASSKAASAPSFPTASSIAYPLRFNSSHCSGLIVPTRPSTWGASAPLPTRSTAGEKVTPSNPSSFPRASNRAVTPVTAPSPSQRTPSSRHSCASRTLLSSGAPSATTAVQRTSSRTSTFPFRSRIFPRAAGTLSTFALLRKDVS